MIIGRSRLSAPPPLKFLNTYPRKFLKLPYPENFSTHPPPPKKKISQPPKKSFTPPPLAICYLIMHIIHNNRQSPTSAALVVSCVFHILSYFSRFETILLFCTLFLESHLINTTSPHFQLPLLIFTTHYCYYHSIRILHIRWYATQLMFF